MTCEHCSSSANVYNMNCIGCAARHCRMVYYPAQENVKVDKWKYVKEVAVKYGYEPRKLADEIEVLSSQKSLF